MPQTLILWGKYPLLVQNDSLFSFRTTSAKECLTEINHILFSITALTHKSNFAPSQLHTNTPQIIFQSCCQLSASAWCSDLMSWPIILGVIAECSVKHRHNLCNKVADTMKRRCKMHSQAAMRLTFFFPPTFCLLSGSVHRSIDWEWKALQVMLVKGGTLRKQHASNQLESTSLSQFKECQLWFLTAGCPIRSV